MMTREAILAEFARWTFKMPGYEMEMVENRFPVEPLPYHLRLVFRVTTQDSHHPEDLRPVVVAHQYTVPSFLSDADHLGLWLRHCVEQVVAHEAMEWLRRAGEIVFDPHRKALP
jgi:hypothetical protein